MPARTPIAFAADLLLPAMSLALVLSLVVNVVLFLTRGPAASPQPAAPPPSAPARQSVEQLPERGFGDVLQGMRMLAQRVDGIPVGPYRYALPEGLLPEVPESLMLYRDPGVEADMQAFARLLQDMSVPIDVKALRLQPHDITFHSADGEISVLVNISERMLEVSRLNRPQADRGAPQPVSGPLADQRLKEIASQFAASLGVSADRYGNPVVIKTNRTVDQFDSAKVYAPPVEEVRWPLLLGDYPVVDSVGRQVSALSVFVSHRSAQALAMNMHVLTPEILLRSHYPIADAATVTGFAMEGGLTPVDDDEKGKPVTVTYQSATIAYVLPRQDPALPTYMAPVLLLTSDIPLSSCGAKHCPPWSWHTYVPLLNPEHFAWLPEEQASSSASSATTSSAQKK